MDMEAFFSCTDSGPENQIAIFLSWILIIFDRKISYLVVTGSTVFLSITHQHLLLTLFPHKLSAALKTLKLKRRPTCMALGEKLKPSPHRSCSNQRL